MQRYNTDTGNWEAPISGQTTGSRSITVPNVFEFSPWAAADQEISPLPVKWGNFEVSKANDKADISWATTSEVNNSHFEVEHSLDGSNFVEIGRVVGNGFSNKLLKYHYIHQKPLKGINYYRLKQVDFNGIFDYSDIRYVKYEPNNEMLIKQFADFIQLEFENTNNEDTQIRMIDFSGKLIDIQKVEKGEGIASVNINTQHLAAGAYNIQLIRNGIYVNNVTVAVRK
jgi:hypothetical protein